jgi:hypothetical protein
MKPIGADVVARHGESEGVDIHSHNNARQGDGVTSDPTTQIGDQLIDREPLGTMDCNRQWSCLLQ